MPFVLRRTKDAVLADLPPKIVQARLAWGQSALFAQLTQVTGCWEHAWTCHVQPEGL